MLTSESISTRAVLLASILPVLFICRTLYNLFLHPLAKYPGPWFFRASRLPYLYYQVSGRLPQTTKKIHDNYGPIVRIAPNNLSFTQSQAWFDIHGHRTTQGMKRFERDPNLYVNLPKQGPSILMSNESDHSRFRKLLSHAFSAQALREQEPTIQLHVDLLMQRLYEEIDGPERGEIDINAWMNYVTFDIIGNLAFGESFGCLQNKRSHPWMEIVFSSLRQLVYLSALSYLPNFVYSGVLWFIQHVTLKDLQENQNYAAEKVHERITQGTTQDDFMSPVLKANDEKGMSTKEIESSFNVIIVAGSETTAVAVSAMLYHLACYPHTMKKIVDELTSAFESPGQISMENVENLPYLNAIIHEVLRIFPPASSTNARMVPPGGASVCGEFLPAGVIVGVGTYAASLSHENWTDPDEFKPERWLGEGFQGDDLRSSQPFIVGPRACIGKNLSYAEMRLILSNLLLRFEWNLCDESRGWKHGQRLWLVWQRPPLYFKITRRVISQKS